MIAALRNVYDQVLGRGSASVTVPAMDGALKPNAALDRGTTLTQLPAPDNLVARAGAVLFSSGAAVLSLAEDGSTLEILRCETPVAALATSPAGRLALALASGVIRVSRDAADAPTQPVEAPALTCPTALAFLDEDTLLVANGSARNAAEAWQRDLMLRVAAGSVWRIDLRSGKAVCLADGLAFPYGLLPVGEGRQILVSESWRSRLLLLDATAPSAPTESLGDLPGYPARLAPAAGGGVWLSVFAPRNQLIEFVMREPAFLKAMMAEVSPEHWIAPSLSSARSFHEPLQGGGVKQMGILKPWAPTRSYGLVVRLDAAFRPMGSLHNRADGRRHGVTSCLELGDTLLVAAKGGDELVAVPSQLPRGRRA